MNKPEGDHNLIHVVDRISMLRPREQYVYHVGQSLTGVPLIQRATRKAYEEGRVLLALRRITREGDFAYIAIGREPDI